MFDDTPAPLGGVARRWACLDDGARERHSVRLLGLDCPGNQIAHVETPQVDDGACYHRLVMAARSRRPSPTRSVPVERLATIVQGVGLSEWISRGGGLDT